MNNCVLAKIQSIKKGVPKGDRARLKEAQKKIAVLENDLKSKQAKELEELEKQVKLLYEQLIELLAMHLPLFLYHDTQSRRNFLIVTPNILFNRSNKPNINPLKLFL